MSKYLTNQQPKIFVKTTHKKSIYQVCRVRMNNIEKKKYYYYSQQETVLAPNDRPRPSLDSWNLSLAYYTY